MKKAVLFSVAVFAAFAGFSQSDAKFKGWVMDFGVQSLSATGAMKPYMTPLGFGMRFGVGYHPTALRGHFEVGAGLSASGISASVEKMTMVPYERMGTINYESIYTTSVVGVYGYARGYVISPYRHAVAPYVQFQVGANSINTRNDDSQCSVGRGALLSKDRSMVQGGGLGLHWALAPAKPGGGMVVDLQVIKMWGDEVRHTDAKGLRSFDERPVSGPVASGKYEVAVIGFTNSNGETQNMAVGHLTRNPLEYISAAITLRMPLSKNTPKTFNNSAIW
jgi:hypothetical protein